MTQNINQLADLGKMDTNYQQAFPTSRVFIYGVEVTRDVISININQSGGSIERSPGTCAIILSNMQDKYMINHHDMSLIGRMKVERNNRAKGSSNTSKKVSSILCDVEDFDIIYPLGGGQPVIEWSSEQAQELIPRLLLANDEELLYLLGAYGFNNISVSDARSIVSTLKKKYDELSKKSSLNTIVSGSWDEGDIPFNVKGKVVSEKLKHTVTFIPYDDDVSFLNSEDKLAYDYPFQEGDCIFHANDPVRVAFRDPYDPRRWYWMFTGFVDIWTENVGGNLESQVSITCTDVTKMLRYSTVQLRNSGRDPNIEEEIAKITQKGGSTLESSGLILNASIFSGLRLQEILELIFFGSQSTVNVLSLNPKFFELYFDVVRKTPLSDSEFLDLAVNVFGMSVPEAMEKVPYGLDSLENSSSGFSKEIKNKVVSYLQKKASGRISSLEWQGVSTPRDVYFKRKSSKAGVHFFVLGDPTNPDPSELDKIYGAESVSDLYAWNEYIHHRVRLSDLETMRNKESLNTLYNPDFIQWDGPDADISVDQVISRIGRDIESYPVGHGRVFYFAPPYLSDLTAVGIMDRGIDAGVCAAAHSTFADRLTLLYDVVDLIDWRFYATPKGDIVFEIPFYDHEPGDFFKPKQQNADLSDTYKEKLQRYEDIFQKQYTGKYTVAEAKELTDLTFEFNTSNENLIDFNKSLSNDEFDYSKEFVIRLEDQSGFSNTFSDRGLTTVYGFLVNYVQSIEGANNDALKPFAFVYDKSLIPILGKRVSVGNLKGFIANMEAGKLFSALELNRKNAEARSASIDTIPKFSLMVNRPILWQYRNYYANIVSLTHSLSYNNEATSSIDINQIKAWGGVFDEKGNPVYKHFYDRDRPFDFADLLSKSGAKSKDGNSGNK